MRDVYLGNRMGKQIPLFGLHFCVWKYELFWGSEKKNPMADKVVLGTLVLALPACLP